MEQNDKNQKSDKNSEDLSLLQLAAKNYAEQLTLKLLLPGQDVNERKGAGQDTPLLAAVKNNKGKSHFEVIEILLINGADPNARDYYDYSPLWYLVQNGGDVEILRLFLKFKADFTCLYGRDGMSLLLPAIDANNLDSLKFLVQDIGLDVNHQSKNYFVATPLHYTASKNINDSHYEVLKYLLEMGSEVDARYSEGRTPLHGVIRRGNLRVVKLFLSHKANFGVVENIVFEFALSHRDVEITDKFFFLSTNFEDLNLDINQRDFEGRTPLHHATKEWAYRKKPINTKVFKFMLKNGANINALNGKGVAAVVHAWSEMQEFIEEDEKKGSYFADFLFEQADFSVELKGMRHRLRQDIVLKKLILQHLAKIKFLSVSIHPTLQILIEASEDNRNYFENCTKELEVMSKTKLKNSWISYFNLLVDDRRKLKNYAGNEDLIEDYKNNDWLEMFPIYGDLMKRNVDKGIRRRKLFDKSTVLLSECLPIFNPNHLIVKDILDCVLSKKDLSKFCACN